MRKILCALIVVSLLAACGGGGGSGGSNGTGGVDNTNNTNDTTNTASSVSLPYSNSYYPAIAGKYIHTTTTNPDNSTGTTVSAVVRGDDTSMIRRSSVAGSTSYGETEYVLNGNYVAYTKSTTYNNSDDSVVSTTIYSTPVIVFPDNLSAGSTGSSESDYTTTVGSVTTTGHISKTVAIVGLESVTVPSGTGQALKTTISTTQTPTNGNPTSFSYTYWYAPNIGTAKYQSYNQQTPASVTTVVMNSYGTDSAPLIANLSISPTSAHVNDGGGSITVNMNGTFVSAGRNVTKAFIEETNPSSGILLKRYSVALTGTGGLTAGTFATSWIFSTLQAVVGTRNLSIYIVDSYGVRSNYLSSLFSLS